MKHEHTRTDRDTYVSVDSSIIHDDFDHNYFKCGDCTDLGFYDYESIMHYGLGMPVDWAKTPGDTTSPIVVVQDRFDDYEECWWEDDGSSPDIGQRSFLTWEDEWAYRLRAPVCLDSPSDRFWQVPDEEVFECDEAIPDPDCIVYGATCSAGIGEATWADSVGTGDSCSNTRQWTWSYDGSQTSIEHDVVDSTGPIFTSFPPDWSGTCSDYPPPAGYTVDDNCNGVTVNEDPVRVTPRPECANTLFTETVEYSLEDSCGNPGEVRSRVFDVAPVNDAVLTIPSDIEVACHDSTDPADTGIATAQDECDDLSSIVTYEDVLRQPGDCYPGWSEIIYRTWSVVGCNGVKVSAVQHIWIRPCCFTQGCVFGPQGDLDCQEHTATGSYCHADGTCQGCEPGTGCCNVGRGGFGETDDYDYPGDCTTCGGCDEDSDCPPDSYCMTNQDNQDAPFVCHGEHALDPCGQGLNPEPSPSACVDYCMDWKTPPTCHNPPGVECYSSPVDPQHDPVPGQDDTPPNPLVGSCQDYCMFWQTPKTCHIPAGQAC